MYKIRSLAIGIKNYLFCGNDDAVRAAIIYSLIGTCKAVDVEPRDLMTDVLMKLSIYKQEKMDMKELLHMNWNKE